MPPRAEPMPLSSSIQSVPEAEGAVTRRSFAYGGLALLLGGAVATKFAAHVPSGAAAAATQGSPGTADRAHEALMQFASLDPAAAEAAVAASSIPPAQRPGVLAAVRERRMHLIQAPFFGVGPTVGQAVTVSCGLISVPLVLGAEPRAVLLPITRTGTIVVTSANPQAGVDDAIGVVTTLGPHPLPAPDAAHELQINVIVQ